MSDGRQANPDAPVVRLRDVTKAYQLEGRPLQVLRGITLDVAAGQIVAITGSSGAGKSTLLHIVGALDKATSGHVEVGGERLGEMKAGELADFRNGNIGFVFQFHHLLPEFTAAENVAMPLLILSLLAQMAGAVQLGVGIMNATVLVVVIDGVWLRFRLRRQLVERFGKEHLKGTTFYAFMRALQMRFMRVPKPQKRIGQPLSGHYPRP